MCGVSAIEIEGELDRNREKIAGIRDKVRPRLCPSKDRILHLSIAFMSPDGAKMRRLWAHRGLTCTCLCLYPGNDHAEPDEPGQQTGHRHVQVAPVLEPCAECI